MLRWVYQDQAADEVSRRAGTVMPGGVGCTLAAIAERARLGARIDCAGSVNLDRAELHPDAETVHEAVRRLDALRVGLVISHAKTGDRPDWMEGAVVRAMPVLRADGRPRMEYHDTEGRRPAYCLLRYDPEPEHVAFVRSVYMAWWDGLDRLVGDLRGRLDDHHVTGPNVAREPWA